MNTSRERQKAEKAYKKALLKKEEILSNFTEDEISTLYRTDYGKYRSYRRYCKQIEDLKSSGLLSLQFLMSCHESPNTSFQDSSKYCKNCLRKQSNYLMNNFGELYTLQFVRVRSDEIAKRSKFRRVKYASGRNMYLSSLCMECWNYLNPDVEIKTAKSNVNTWPAFVCTVLLNSKALHTYGIKLWQLVPQIWRHWWIDTLPLFATEYSNISLDHPTPLFFDRSNEVIEWNTLIASQSLPNIAKACNKYMIPCVLCPWGCSEFIFHTGHVSLDIVFQRYLKKVNLDLIHDISVMKYIQHSRDDFIRWSGVYDVWLLNPNWAITPSICFVRGKGMQVMVCKDHNSGSRHLYLHPIRQPEHILPCKFSDQVCHAVIKPRTITQMKAQLYSNTFQMQEQRGNFNGIDTCSVTQYRNFKLLSYLLQENESRSIRGRPDINALLDEFVKESLIPAEFAETFRQTAKQRTLHHDIDDLISGGTYVPAEAAIRMQQHNKIVRVIWDGLRSSNNEDDNPEQYESRYMKSRFPSILYPLQKCDEYGIIPYTLPTYMNNNSNTSMLWLLTGILTRVEEIWKLVLSFELRQSCWHGWILSYITSNCLTHITNKTSKGDPFQLSFMRNCNEVLNKIVSVSFVLFIV